MKSTKKCGCGCGDFTSFATVSSKKWGWIKGQPVGFIRGHNGRLRPSGIISFIIDDETGCWIRQRSKIPNGYGHSTVQNEQVSAHIFVYEKLKGTIPKTLELDHCCRNPACVNPDHLEPVTHAENCRRGKRAELKHETVMELKRLFNSGSNISELSRNYGLDRHTIRSAVKGGPWA